tara:strand:+ start:404 stop:589 length:186 start_codon:yes stop_codon:yes gene_type:complete
MTHAVRQLVKDKITDIHPNNYTALKRAVDKLEDDEVAELLDIIREMESRATLEKNKRWHRY